MDNNNNIIDVSLLMSLGLSNLQVITENNDIVGVRGQTLSTAKNHKHLKVIKVAGVNAVIDIRATDYNANADKFVKACETVGIKYHHFPVDKSHTADIVIIQNLPMMFEVINRKGFYIACAQGLHRTDIALALNFLLNPKAAEPPIMYGHISKGKFRCDDIFSRAHRIYRGMTTDDKDILGWDEAFDKGFIERKKRLIEVQMNEIANCLLL